MSIYEKFFFESRDLLATCTPDGFFKNLSPTWEKLFGWTPQELTSKPSIEFIHPEDRTRTLSEMQEHLPGRGKKLIDNRFINKDGEYHWLSWSFTPSSSENLIWAVARDITQLRKNNLSLEALMV